jgi:hypothetical protein
MREGPNATLLTTEATLNNSTWTKLVSTNINRTYMSILNNASTYPIRIGFGQDTVEPTSSYQILGGLTTTSSSSLYNIGVFKFGVQDSVQNVEQTVWEYGGIYTYPTTAVVMTVTSSVGATDNGCEIAVNGLDENYNEVTEVLTLSGAGTATTTTTFIRVFRGYVAGSQDTTGNITIGNGANVYSYVNADNQTLQAFYTIPAGYTARLLQTDHTISTEQNNKFGQIRIIVRRPNGVFRTQESFTIDNGSISRVYSTPIYIPEKSDIEVRAIASGANAFLHISSTIELGLTSTAVNFSNSSNQYEFRVAPINTVWAKTTSPNPHTIKVVHDD